jgi:dihydroorotate dehydrogenase
MYKKIIRPLLFLLDPEKVHHLIVFFLKFGFKIPGIKLFVKSSLKYNNPNLTTNVFGLTFKNPVGMAAGFDKNAKCYEELSAFGFSFIEIGTVTPKGQAGNEKPRLFRLPEDNAIINRMGFNNMGVDYAVERLKKRKGNVIIGGNIGKNTATPNSEAVEDYAYCFTRLYDYVDYFVINVSCPNVANIQELQDKNSLARIIQKINEIKATKKVSKPVLLKLSPDLTFPEIDEAVEVAVGNGIDGFVVSNTTTKRNNLISNDLLIQKIGRGGLSGKPLSKRSTEIISYINKRTNSTKPIIATGGIMNEEDAIEKLKAGASLIQIYTGFIYEGPALVKRLNKAISKYRK